MSSFVITHSPRFKFLNSFYNKEKIDSKSPLPSSNSSSSTTSPIKILSIDLSFPPTPYCLSPASLSPKSDQEDEEKTSQNKIKSVHDHSIQEQETTISPIHSYHETSTDSSLLEHTQELIPHKKCINIRSLFKKNLSDGVFVLNYEGQFTHINSKITPRRKGFLNLEGGKSYFGEFSHGIPHGTGQFNTLKYKVTTTFQYGKSHGITIIESHLKDKIKFALYDNGVLQGSHFLIQCQKFIDNEAITQQKGSIPYKDYSFCEGKSSEYKIITKFETPFRCPDGAWPANSWRYVGNMIREFGTSFPHGFCLVRVAPQIVVYGNFYDGFPNDLTIVETPEIQFSCTFEKGKADGLGIVKDKITGHYNMARYNRGDLPRLK